MALVDLILKRSHGLELIKTMRRQFPEVPALVLSMHDESLYAQRALQAGARGYIGKEQPLSEVLKAIRQVLRGEIYLSDKMVFRLLQGISRSRHFPEGSPIQRLSNRELEESSQGAALG